MNILVVGQGGREHALAAALAKSPQTNNLYCAPGNPGIQQTAECVNIPAGDISALTEFARTHDIDLVVPGPEDSLAAGLADAMQESGIAVFGPTKAAASIESSKDFAKKLMTRAGIPTAAYQTFTDLAAAKAWVQQKGVPIVIKEDGLKAGKGVTVARTEEEALQALESAFASENRVVIEDCLEGFEYSLICLVHGKTVVPLEAAQDHKPALDGDKGPNTGGMGSYSPVKTITPAIIEETVNTVMKPAAAAMETAGIPFTGFLYGGLMLTKDGIKVIEFNARFGDPEAEVILPRLESDFVQAIQDVMAGKEPELVWSPKTSHGVVLASTGYPAGSTKGAVIETDPDMDALLFHMGTREEDGTLYTNGGRVLMAVTLEDTLEEAFAHTYSQVEKIHCDHLFCRTDIGKKDMQ